MLQPEKSKPSDFLKQYWCEAAERRIREFDRAFFPYSPSVFRYTGKLGRILMYADGENTCLFDSSAFLKMVIAHTDGLCVSDAFDRVRKIAELSAVLAARAKLHSVRGISFRTRRASILDDKIPWGIRGQIAKSEKLRHMEAYLRGPIETRAMVQTRANIDCVITGIFVHWGHSQGRTPSWYHCYLAR